VIKLPHADRNSSKESSATVNNIINRAKSFIAFLKEEKTVLIPYEKIPKRFKSYDLLYVGSARCQQQVSIAGDGGIKSHVLEIVTQKWITFDAVRHFAGIVQQPELFVSDGLSCLRVAQPMSAESAAPRCQDFYSKKSDMYEKKTLPGNIWTKSPSFQLVLTKTRTNVTNQLVPIERSLLVALTWCAAIVL